MEELKKILGACGAAGCGNTRLSAILTAALGIAASGTRRTSTKVAGISVRNSLVAFI
jgi:hypothetical protein